METAMKESQFQRIEIYTAQIDKAACSSLDLLIMGDLNLCSQKWLSPSYPHKKVASILIRPWWSRGRVEAQCSNTEPILIPRVQIPLWSCLYGEIYN